MAWLCRQLESLQPPPRLGGKEPPDEAGAEGQLLQPPPCLGQQLLTLCSPYSASRGHPELCPTTLQLWQALSPAQAQSRAAERLR